MRWLLIDRLEECEPGKRAVALKTFPRSDLLFMDHFPGRELVPGVLQIEMVAQTAGACLKLWRRDVFAVLSRVISARFRRPIGPGEQCRISAEITKLRSHFVVVAGFIEVAGRKMAEAELMVAVVPGVRFDAPKDAVIEDWLQRSGGTREQHRVETCIETFTK
jgi:3-hydroxyacyl-[acyl-carrier-protein] dehydratase